MTMYWWSWCVFDPHVPAVGAESVILVSSSPSSSSSSSSSLRLRFLILASCEAGKNLFCQILFFLPDPSFCLFFFLLLLLLHRLSFVACTHSTCLKVKNLIFSGTESVHAGRREESSFFHSSQHTTYSERRGADIDTLANISLTLREILIVWRYWSSDPLSQYPNHLSFSCKNSSAATGEEEEERKKVRHPFCSSLITVRRKTDCRKEKQKEEETIVTRHQVYSCDTSFLLTLYSFSFLPLVDHLFFFFFFISCSSREKRENRKNSLHQVKSSIQSSLRQDKRRKSHLVVSFDPIV